MAEILFYKIINNEIDLDQFLQWLVNYQSNDVTFNEFKCNQADFITYFLNLIHQDIPNFCSKWKQEVNRNNFKQINLDDSPNITMEINKSYSFPMDLTNNSCSGSNSELMVAKAASTPKMSKFGSDTILNGSYMSPISPLYQPNTTKSHRNNHEKSPICLGDFIIDKRFSSSSIKKKSRFNNTISNNNDNSTKQRRIKPTNLTEKLNNSEKYEGSFNFLQNSCDDNNIEIVKNQEKLIQKSTIIKLNQNIIEIEPKLNRINYRKQLDCLIKIYITLINNSFILNLINEINFLITLLVKKQYNCNNVDNDGELLQITELQQLFETIHNLIYFVTKILESQFEVFAVNFDRFTLKLLTENQRLVEFTPKFVRKLMKIYEKKEQLSIITTTTTDMVVCFNIDTDNRENFPNDLSFHSFRKQRDLFYEILQIWDLQHLNNEWNFFMSLTGKIRTLFNLCQNESMNYLHMARLFKLQLLNCCICNNNQQQQQLNDVVGNLSIDVEKLNRLKQRLTTKDSLLLSTSSLTTFNGREEFFKDFILAANNLYFNRYLCDTLICEIVELNETNFNFTDLGGDVKEIQLDLSTKKSYFTCIKSLRLLAKFLGFIESLPYQMDGNCLTQNLIGQHLKVRGQVQPNFDIKTILEESIHRKTLILCIPWLTIYLSMLDYITLRLPYYQIIGKILFEIYQNFNYFESKKNYYLIKFCLGYLFELQQYPIDEYYNYLFYDKKLITTPSISTDNNNDDNNMITIDNLDIIDQNLLYQCCPNLNNIKQLLLSTTTTNQETDITIKHVTPVTTLDTIDEMNRKRLQQQLEEAFLNGQPISIRKTIEFISERIASICVKYIINIIIPKYKDDYQKNYQQFIIDNNLIQQQQQQLLIDNYKMKQIKQLQQQCYEEILELSTNKIKISIDTLISFDILPQTKDVCCNITKRTCLERVKQWITSHITISSIFIKDTDNNDNIDNNNGDNKKRNKPLFVLPPEGNNNKHNDSTISAAHLLEQLWDLSIVIIENTDNITDNDLTKLLDDILLSIKERGDINECILATMCTMLVDLALLLLAHKSESLLNPLILEKLYEIWQLYYLGTNELFKTLLSVRNVNLLAQSKHVDLAWMDFAKFSLFLIRKQLLNCEQFEQQCTGLFRTDWNQQTLRLLTNYLKEFVRLYRNTGGNADDFMFLLDFLSDYCEDL